MVNSSQESSRKKQVLKIIIPLLIVIAVGAIWFAKNAGKPLVSESYAGNVAISLKNPEFALHVTKELDLKRLKSFGLPIMIDFGADSCAPCKEMAPVLEKLNEKLQGKAIIKFVDVWKYQKLAEGYPLRVIPTQIFFDKDGKPYVPSDSQTENMNMFSLKNTNEHVFTTHEGGMTEARILAVFKEMGMKE